MPRRPGLEGLLRQYYAALDSGDVNAALAFFTDDAVYRRGPLCPPPPANPCVGKEAIRRSLEATIAGQNRHIITAAETSGDTVTARVPNSGAAQRATGVERIIQVHRVTFRDGKIAVFIEENDLSDPQTALFTYVARVGTIRNVASAAAIFADDSVLEGIGLCAAVPCVGKAAVQRELERQINDNIQFTFIAGSAAVSGDTFFRRTEIRSDSIRAAGVDRIIAQQSTHAGTRGIVLMIFSADLSDAQTQAFVTGQRPAAAPAAAPAIQPPSTGDGGLVQTRESSRTAWVVMLGGLVLAGAVLKARRSRGANLTGIAFSNPIYEASPVSSISSATAALT